MFVAGAEGDLCNNIKSELEVGTKEKEKIEHKHQNSIIITIANTNKTKQNNRKTMNQA